MKKLKKFLASACVFLTVFSCLPLSRAAAAYKPSFDINSEAAYLVNLDTETVVFEKNPDKKMYPASLTKIMTAILAIEKVSDPEQVMITAPGYIYDELYLQGASNADIRKGETHSMLDLLYALLLPSACEAASIIGDYLGGGDLYKFFDMMNAKALELGCTDTHFANAHGLFDESQMTTVKDMYKIAKYAMNLPLFAKIVATPSYTMPDVPGQTISRYGPGNPYVIQNTNWLIRKDTDYYNDAVYGIKTGSLDVGRSLVSIASKDGYNYMLVTMGAPYYQEDGATQWRSSPFEDANAIYNWVYDAKNGFTIQTVMKENEIVSEVPVRLGQDADYVRLAAVEDVNALLPASTDDTAIQKVVTLAENVSAPVKKGTILGRVELKLADEVIARMDLAAAENVERSVWLYTLDVAGRFFSQSMVQILFVLLVLLILLYFMFLLRYKQKKRQMRRSLMSRQARRR